MTRNRKDAVRAGAFGGRIEIETRPADLRITFHDNGVGMSRSDLEDYLSSIGKSFTEAPSSSGTSSTMPWYNLA